MSNNIFTFPHRLFRFSVNVCFPAIAFFAVVSVPLRNGFSDDASANDPHERKFLLRAYDFSDTTRENPVAKNLASSNGTPLLRYKTDAPWEIVEGFAGSRERPEPGAPGDDSTSVASERPRSRAVRIDAGYFESEPFPVQGDSFAVEMRVRILGPGTQTGNDGSRNGTLFGMGDGYWSGMRYTVDCNTWLGGFSLGRPQPRSAVHLGDDRPLPRNTWTHIYVTRSPDGMSVFVDGVPRSHKAFDEPFAAPNWGFRIGYNNAGVGSVNMDVDSVFVYSRALPGAVVLRRALDCAPFGKRFSDACDRAAEHLLRERPENMPHDPETPMSEAETAEEKSVARYLGAIFSLRRGRRAEATTLFAQLSEDERAPATLRNVALRNCVPAESTVPLLVCGDAAFYEKLLQIPGLSEEQKTAIRTCLLRLAAAQEGPETAHASAHRESGREPSEMRRYRETAGRLVSGGYVHDFRREEAAEIANEKQRISQGKTPWEPVAAKHSLPERFNPSVTFFVAPDGAVDGAGTRERPFATLTQARDAIRSLRKNRLARGEDELPAGGIAVCVRGGTYAMPPQLNLDERDSGTAACPIVYRRYENEAPVFSGSRALSGFTKTTDPDVQDRLRPESRGRLVQVDLKNLGIDVAALPKVNSRGFGANGPNASPWVDVYVDDRPLQIARYPNAPQGIPDADATFLRTGEILSEHRTGAESRAPGEFTYTDARIDRWKRAGDIWLFGYWKHLWAANSVKVESLDPRTKRITVATGANPYGYVKDAPFFAFNLLEEIDVPGEWFLDRASGILYIDPPEGVDLDDRATKVRLSVMDRPFLVLKNVSHTTFYRLNFEDGCSSGAIVEGGNDVCFAGCSFKRFGAWGLSVHGRRHRVTGCDVFQLGGGGVSVGGGEVRTLVPGESVVENNHIAELTRVDRVYGPAVSLDGVGHRVAHNLMHHSPAHGMRMGGFGHTIEFNEVHSVVYESDDQSGIDMFGNPTWRGNVIRYNYWHHIGSGRNVAGQSGIRLDDMISGVFMYGNVFYKSADGRFGGIQIHGGKDNIAENNLFLHCKAAFSFSPWGERRWWEQLENGPFAEAVRRSGVDVRNEPLASRYPPLKHLRDDADRNFLLRNAAVDCGTFALYDRGVNVLIDNVHLSGNVLEERDRVSFDRLGRPAIRYDWPVYRMIGMRPLPIEKMGLYRDPQLRPVVEKTEVLDRRPDADY